MAEDQHRSGGGTMGWAIALLVIVAAGVAAFYLLPESATSPVLKLAAPVLDWLGLSQPSSGPSASSTESTAVSRRSAETDQTSSQKELCSSTATLDSLPADELIADAQDCVEKIKLDAALQRYEAAYRRGSAKAALKIAAMYCPSTWSATTSPFPRENQESADLWNQRAHDLDSNAFATDPCPHPANGPPAAQ